MPLVGLGTSAILAVEPFLSALKVGYLHIDTATRYQNEEYIGEAIKIAESEGIVKRSDLFLTTKLWHDDYKDPEAALRLSLKKLQTNYVDLYLIHWPLNGHCEAKVPMHKLWASMEALVEKGLTKAIGVSNFSVQLLADMLAYCKIRPAVNQVQLYPECAQEELCKWLQANDIVPVAYSPVGRLNATDHNNATVESVNHEYVIELAKKYGKSPVQIILAWGLSRGCAVIPKSANAQR